MVSYLQMVKYFIAMMLIVLTGSKEEIMGKTQ
jgi:hypothetical protein